MATMSASRIRSLYRRHTQGASKSCINFPRTQYGMLSVGSQQPEPQKPRQCLPLTNASALLCAGRWRKQGSPN